MNIKNNFLNVKKFLNQKRKENPFIKVVMTNGCFDVLHVGHLEMIKEAKSFGDILIVGLNSDESVKKLKGLKRPINTEKNRKILLEELRCVDFVEIFNSETCEDLIKAIKPNVYVKSSDRTLKTLNEKERKALEKNGTQIKFVKFKKGFSSTNILNKI